MLLLLLLPVSYVYLHMHEAEWDHAMIMRFGDRRTLTEGRMNE